MNTFLHSKFYVLVFLGGITVFSVEEIFLVRPGDGDVYVYSPIEVNATLYCVVNATNLVWEVDMLGFERPLQKSTLDSRGIFQSGTHTSSDGVTMSNVRVFGSTVNNKSRICCQSLVDNSQTGHLKEVCTTLIIYEQPSPPENVSIQYTGESDLIRISWTSTTLMGVKQNYTINFDTYVIETSELYYIYRQNTTDSSITCNAFVRAVNGAGFSDPSNVTIPSLPDLGPVTASLTHQVWKSDDNIMVNVSFEPALFCVESPVLSYLLKMKPQGVGNAIEVTLGSNETYAVLGPLTGLEVDHKYVYTVTAFNVIGNTTSAMGQKLLIISDLQAVSVKVVGEFAIDVLCQFIQGSDAYGCKVVLISGLPIVNSKQATLQRNNTYASGRLNLTHKISCYCQISAFHIDNNKKISNVSIEEKVISETSIFCSSGNRPLPDLIAILIPTILTITLFIVMVAVISPILLKKSVIISEYSKSKAGHDGTEHDKFKTTNSSKNYPLLTQSKASTSPLKCSHTTNVSYPDTTQAKGIPVYAFPEKFKRKDKLDKYQLEKDSSGSPQDMSNNEENVYYVLENNGSLHMDKAFSADPNSQELPPPLGVISSQSETATLTQSSAPLMTSNADSEDNMTLDCHHETECHHKTNVPLYAVPDKLKSKFGCCQSKPNQGTCTSVEKNELMATVENTNKKTHESFYHVLEDCRAQCKGGYITDTYPNPDVPDIPPASESGFPAHDQFPIYQDIMGLPAQANKVLISGENVRIKDPGNNPQN